MLSFFQSLISAAEQQGVSDAQQGNLETVREWADGERVTVLPETWRWLKDKGMTDEHESSCEKAYARGWNAMVSIMIEEAASRSANAAVEQTVRDLPRAFGDVAQCQRKIEAIRKLLAQEDSDWGACVLPANAPRLLEAQRTELEHMLESAEIRLSDLTTEPL